MATESTGGQEDTGRKKAREKVGDGIRQGIGVLSAFKEALEETINEARERGDLSADRAKEVMKDALGRAQAAAADARERLDFVKQTEFEALQGTVEDIGRRVAALEAKAFGPKEGEGGGP